ncbi:MAG TPA: hypothetical protein VKX28_13835 [Xanthobacteraceae bacterium]|nr:hypothetical protein [Xanthobacteraceae bacterium]
MGLAKARPDLRLARWRKAKNPRDHSGAEIVRRKYRRFTMKDAGRLQCKALRRQRKTASARTMDINEKDAKNNGNNPECREGNAPAARP